MTTRPGHLPLRVVIVDDTQAIRHSLRVLVDAHAELEVVGTGEDGVEGIDIVRATRPDVVLLDYRMPRMDGIEAARVIRAELPETRIVMLSAYDDLSIMAYATAAGVDDFLCKGVAASVIHAALLGK